MMRTGVKNGMRALVAGALAGIIVVGASACSAVSDGESESQKEAVVSSPTIITDGKLTVCASFSNPPDNFKNESGDPDGAEMGIAEALADQLGLEVDYKQYAFSGLIPALQAQQCDTILSSLYIKPEREEVVDFVPYLTSGSAVLVSAEGTSDITGYDDSLCGRKVAASNGSTGATKADELSDQCTSGGKDALDITLTEKTTDSLSMLQAGQVDAMISTVELTDYYVKKSDGTLKRAGDGFAPIEIGAATVKTNTDLHDALASAFEEIQQNGEYASILDEWGISDSAISAE